MVHEGFGPFLLGKSVDEGLVGGVLEGLQYRVEHALLRLYLLVGDVLDVAGVFAEGLLGAFAFLVEVHLCLPGLEVGLAVIEDHLQFQ